MSKFRQSWWKASRFSPYNLVLKVAGAFDKLCQPLLFLFTDYCKQLGNRRGTTPGHIEGILRLFTPKSPHQTFCILILPGVFRIQLHPFPVLFLAAFVYQLSKPSCQNAFEARQIIPICFDDILCLSLHRETFHASYNQLQESPHPDTSVLRSTPTKTATLR